MTWLTQIKRYFGELKNRTRSMRGTSDDKGARNYAYLHRINHNFIKLHMILNNQTPAQIVGINLPLGKNKWLAFKISARSKYQS